MSTKPPPEEVHVEAIARGTHEGHRRAVEDSGVMRLFWESAVKHGGSYAMGQMFKWIGAKIILMVIGGALAALIVVAVRQGWIK